LQGSLIQFQVDFTCEWVTLTRISEQQSKAQATTPLSKMFRDNKFILLVWKNYVLQKRHKVQTVFEILVPVFFSLMLVGIRQLADSEIISDPTYFPSFHPAEVLHFSDSGIKQM
jgi:ABC-type polysaccharide transport system permease subunit